MPIVYTHTRNDNNQIFYIGIGKTEKRAYINNGNQRNNYWHRIAKNGYTINITHKNICWQEACIIEKYLIAFYRELYGKYKLANITNGGEGSLGLVMSVEAKQKMRLKKLGTKATKTTNEKRSESMKKTLKNPEIRQKYKDAALGRKHNQESKKIMGELKKGGNNPKARKVLNTITGQVYSCMRDAAQDIGMPVGTLQHQLTGYCKNKTNLLYLCSL